MNWPSLTGHTWSNPWHCKTSRNNGGDQGSVRKESPVSYTTVSRLALYQEWMCATNISTVQYRRLKTARLRSLSHTTSGNQYRLGRQGLGTGVVETPFVLSPLCFYSITCWLQSTVFLFHHVLTTVHCVSIPSCVDYSPLCFYSITCWLQSTVFLFHHVLTTVHCVSIPSRVDYSPLCF